jgi:hypothetical protein
VAGLQTALDSKLDTAIAGAITATKPTIVGADTSIVLDSVDGFAPKLVTETARQSAMLAAVRSSVPFAKSALNLSFLDSTNTPDDITPRYITHIDILPSEFDFPESGWSAEIDFVYEGGLKGVDEFALTTVGTLAKEVRFYFGLPGGSTATLAGVTTTHTLAQTAPQRTSSMRVLLVGTPESLGQVVEAQNIGGGNSYGSSTNNLNRQPSRAYRDSGLRILLAGLYGAAGAGHIIKIRSFKITLGR